MKHICAPVTEFCITVFTRPGSRVMQYGSRVVASIGTSLYLLSITCSLAIMM